MRAETCAQVGLRMVQGWRGSVEFSQNSSGLRFRVKGHGCYRGCRDRDSLRFL